MSGDDPLASSRSSLAVQILASNRSQGVASLAMSPLSESNTSTAKMRFSDATGDRYIRSRLSGCPSRHSAAACDGVKRPRGLRDGCGQRSGQADDIEASTGAHTAATGGRGHHGDTDQEQEPPHVWEQN